MESKDVREIVRAIEDQTREIRDLKRTIEKVGKPREEPFVRSFPEQPASPKIHLAFMDPNDPRPTCWDHTGLGGKFTMTNYPEQVTCPKCLKVMNENK